jgi:hypothetical protein
MSRTALYAVVAAVSLVTAGLQAADASSNVPEAVAIDLGQQLVNGDAPSARLPADSAAAER